MVTARPAILGHGQVANLTGGGCLELRPVRAAIESIQLNLINPDGSPKQPYSTITAVPLAETISIPLSFPIIS